MPYPSYQYPNFQPMMQSMQPQMQMQQPMQVPVFNQPIMNNQLQGISGKIVDSIEVVKATDIPVDGSNHYFPKADNSEIYTKRWLPNGTTEVMVFRKVDENIPEEPKVDLAALETNIIEHLEMIDERIDRLQRGLIPKGNTRKEQS